MLKMIILFFITNVCFAKAVYIKSLKADLLSEAKMGSKVLESIKKGTEVKELSRSGTFAQIEFNTSKGFVSTLFLSEKPILNGGSILSQDVDISTQARKRASGFTSAAAARGLKTNSDDVFKDLGDSDFVSLKQMESFVVTSDIGFNFISDQNLKLEKK